MFIAYVATFTHVLGCLYGECIVWEGEDFVARTDERKRKPHGLICYYAS